MGECGTAENHDRRVLRGAVVRALELPYFLNTVYGN